MREIFHRILSRKKQAQLQGPVAISILAGGRSTRMGRNKARLPFGQRSLLEHVRAVARKAGRPVRVIRRDLVPRCGPLGGIYTALKTSRAEVELFLACDMPFVSTALLSKLVSNLGPKRDAVFATFDGTAGFPFLMRVSTLPIVARQIGQKHLSVQALAKALRAKLVRVPRRHEMELCNINTPEEWARARRNRRWSAVAALRVRRSRETRRPSN